MIEKYVSTARISLESDISIGYQVNVSKGLRLVEEGNAFLLEMKEVFTPIMEKARETSEERRKEIEQKEKDQRRRRDEIRKEIDELKSYGLKWCSSEYKRQEEIDVLESQLMALILNGPSGYYKFGTLYQGYAWDVQRYLGEDLRDLKTLKNILSIVSSDDVPLSKEEALLLSSIESGEFKDKWENRIKRLKEDENV